MNFNFKTLLVLSGAVLLSSPALFAQGHFSGGGRASVAGHPSFSGRSAFAARPASRAFASGAGYRGTYGRGGYYRGGYRHGGYGRYYYLGGIPYFYPFFGYGYGYGFGYPFYGDGFYGGYGADGAYGAESGYGNGDQNGAYQGRVTNGRTGNGSDDGAQANGPSLPSAVQRQLAKRGYYRGSVDGEFGPASREALKRFQKSQGLKETGRIDEDSLDALGFTDKRPN